MHSYVWSKFKAFQDKLAGSLAGKMLPLGHAAVSTFPDRPYLDWQYEYEEGSRPTVARHNLENFMEAAEQLYAFFVKFIRENVEHASSEGATSWENISGKIREVLQEEAQLDDRINNWKKFIAESGAFAATDHDKTINYSEEEWSPADFRGATKTPSEIDFGLYMKAARMHQYFVLNELLPANGILI